MSDLFRTTIAGGRVICPQSGVLLDHLTFAVRSARTGETAWMRHRAEQPDDHALRRWDRALLCFTPTTGIPGVQVHVTAVWEDGGDIAGDLPPWMHAIGRVLTSTFSNTIHNLTESPHHAHAHGT